MILKVNSLALRFKLSIESHLSIVIHSLFGISRIFKRIGEECLNSRLVNCLFQVFHLINRTINLDPIMRRWIPSSVLSLPPPKQFQPSASQAAEATATSFTKQKEEKQSYSIKEEKEKGESEGSGVRQKLFEVFLCALKYI